MSNELKNRFEDFEQTPPIESWSKIKSQLPKPKFNWLAFFTIAGAVILVAGVTTIMLSPDQNTNNQIIIDQTSIVSNVSKINQPTNNVDRTNDIQKNDIQIESKLDNSTDNIAKQSNNINQISSNTIIPENKIQHKEAPKASSNNIISNVVTPKNATIIIDQSTQEQESIEDKLSEIIVDDTISSRRELFIPNAFTPNEAENNVFKPEYTKVKNYQMMIFNRSGLLLFTSNDIRLGWNGYFKGRLCDLGAYVYVIKFENLKGKSFIQKGIVNLIR